MTVHLVGGGWRPECARDVYGGFLAQARRSAYAAGREIPRIGVVVVHEPEDPSEGADYFARLETALHGVGPCDPFAVVGAEGEELTPGRLGGADGVLVGGGLTPAYHRAVTPLTREIVALVNGGVPYLGFSAGAALAGTQAVVGGWRLEGRAICPEDSAEELDELSVLDGLSLVDGAVDVHAASWGTLTRLVSAVRTGAVRHGVAIDEDTVVVLGNGRPEVHGAGHAWFVTIADGGVTVQVRTGLV